MIDSDIGNTILPHVRFYQKEVPHAFETEKQGRPVFLMRDFVRIEIPGDRYNIIDTYAGENHKKQYPVEWARYLNEKADTGVDNIQGTLLRDWPLLNPAQAAELKFFHFYTVEQVAQASDEQIGKIGMTVGVSPHSFREKAKAYLARAKDSVIVEQQNEELRKRDAEIEALKKQMEEMMSKMSSMPVVEPKKRGRPVETQE